MTNKKKLKSYRIHERYCFNCKKPLDYRWYRQNNDIGFPAELKLIIWNDKRFQLFCCSCYNAIKQRRLKIRNNKLSVFYKFNTEFNTKDIDLKPTIRDIIRRIDPIDYRTLDGYINE